MFVSKRQLGWGSVLPFKQSSFHLDRRSKSTILFCVISHLLWVGWKSVSICKFQSSVLLRLPIKQSVFILRRYGISCLLFQNISVGFELEAIFSLRVNTLRCLFLLDRTTLSNTSVEPFCKEALRNICFNQYQKWRKGRQAVGSWGTLSSIGALYTNFLNWNDRRENPEFRSARILKRLSDVKLKDNFSTSSPSSKHCSVHCINHEFLKANLKFFNVFLGQN